MRFSASLRCAQNDSQLFEVEGGGIASFAWLRSLDFVVRRVSCIIILRGFCYIFTKKPSFYTETKK
jgi:hypothetical protein